MWVSTSRSQDTLCQMTDLDYGCMVNAVQYYNYCLQCDTRYQVAANDNLEVAKCGSEAARAATGAKTKCFWNQRYGSRCASRRFQKILENWVLQ